MSGQTENSWRSQAFRRAVVAKIEETMKHSGVAEHRDSAEMESRIFQRATTKEEYLAFTARLILYIRAIDANDRKSPETALGELSIGDNETESGKEK